MNTSGIFLVPNVSEGKKSLRKYDMYYGFVRSSTPQFLASPYCFAKTILRVSPPCYWILLLLISSQLTCLVFVTMHPQINYPFAGDIPAREKLHSHLPNKMNAVAASIRKYENRFHDISFYQTDQPTILTSMCIWVDEMKELDTRWSSMYTRFKNLWRAIFLRDKKLDPKVSELRQVLRQLVHRRAYHESQTGQSARFVEISQIDIIVCFAPWKGSVDYLIPNCRKQ